MTGYDEERGLAASAPPLPPHQDTPSSSRMQTPRTERLSSGTSDKAGLYEDLLRRAGGDRMLVSLWLAEMGYEPGQFAEQQQQAVAAGTIKAVGTRSETRLGKWATAGSLSSASSKTKLALTDDKETDLKDLDLDAAEDGAPKHFFCPISMHLMRDPVMVPTGQSYERVCIERWLLQGNSTCPATGQQLQRPVVLTPNVSLRNAIEEWAEKYAPRLLDPSTSRIRALPKEDSFALPLPEQPAAHDPDLALAIRLQHEELARIAASRQSQPSQRQESGAAAGAQQTSRRASSRSQQGQQPQQLLASRSSRSSQRNGNGNGSANGNGASGTDTRARAEWGTWSTLLLAVISAGYIAVYVLSIWQNGWTLEDLTLNPLVGAAQPALMTLGAQTRSSLTEDGQWWRLASSMFVTAGVIQLLGNLTSLWAFGKYLERVLPLPFLSLAGVFLLSGALGALASANLNAYYLTCGASAGVCGFLGGIWADQIFNFKRYTNRVVTMLVLALITTVFVLISLLPLLDPFYTVAALLTGFCSTTILLLLAKVGRDHPGSCGWVVMQTLCAVVLIGGATVAAIGLVTDSGVGQDCEFCKDISCLQVKWWECQEVALSMSGGSCTLTVLADGDQGLQCPSGDVKTLSDPVPAGSDLQALCSQYCAPGSSPTPSPGGSTGGGSGSGGSSGGGGSGSTGGDAGDSSSGAQGGSGGSDIIR